MSTHLYRIFKKIIAIVLALLLISADTLQYAYAAVDQYQQEAISQDVSAQENIDNNNQASDDQNEGSVEVNAPNSNETTKEEQKIPDTGNSANIIDKEASDNESTEDEKTEQPTTKDSKSEDVNQELVVKVGQEKNMSNRDISTATGQAIRIHVTSTGSNANITGAYTIRMEIDNPDVILSDFQRSDGTIRDEVTLDGIKLRLVTAADGKRYIISELTQGSTHQFDFQMIFKNGVTNNGEQVIIKTDILDSNGNVITNQVADE
ncbi:hypothetical protein, partial [Intestinibacter sp.]